MKKVLAFTLSMLVAYTPTLVFASDDKLAKWNTDVSKSIRQSHADKLAQTTYKEINVKDARVSDDISKVYPQIETKVTKDGSATRVVAEAVLNTDKEKVAKDWAKKLNHAAKFGTGVLGGAAVGLMVDQLMDAIDYVMGEGGQVLKKVTPDDPLHPTSQYWYRGYSTSYQGVYQDKRFISVEKACKALDGLYGLTYKHYTVSNQAQTSFSCFYHKSGFAQDYTTPEASVQKLTNPNYDPSAENPTAPASETDIKDAIKTKVLDKAATDSTARNLAKNLVKDSYARIWDDKGNSLEIRGDVTNKQKDILNSNDPTSDGHTTSTPTISDGKSGSGSSSSGSSSSGTSEGTTFNPDGSVASSSVTTTTSTSTTTTNIEFELPAFCDWATTVCDWLDWTQEEPDKEPNQEIQVEEKEFDTSIFSTDRFSVSRQCPTPEVHSLNITGITVEFSFDMTPICQVAELARPALVACSYLYASYIVIGAARNG